MIYLDNAATTKPYLESLEIFNKINAERYFNPSASYSVAFDLQRDLNSIKQEIIKCLGGEENDKIIFTSGATESNNLAIFGSCTNKKKKYLFSIGEHPSVYNCACDLKNKGYDVDFIPLQRNGEIDYDIFESMCDENVCFISIMLVNNETGAINNLNKIANIINLKAKDAVFHVDAVQGFCKVKFSVSNSRVNLCSISAHKIGGIKGIGALYISNKTKIKNINFGGGQEYGIRSGTVNPAAIYSFAKSIEISFKNLEKNLSNVSLLKQSLIENIETKNIKIKVVSKENCSPYVTSLLVLGNRGETVMRCLSSKNIMVGTGSACSSSKVGNRVLENMSYSKSQIIGAIRISFFVDNTLEEVETFVKEVKQIITE